MAKYHVTRFGMFANHIVADWDGYTYTTMREWMYQANPPVKDRGEAKETAAEARRAIDSACEAIARWRREN